MMNGKIIWLETHVTLKVSIVLPPNMEVRERILMKAEELFMQFGIRSVSMDDIASHLAISKKTIYHSFADKNELVDAVIEQDIHCRQDDCMLCGKKALNAVHEIFITMENLMEQFQHMNPVVLYDLEKFHVKSYKKFMEFKNQFLLDIIRKNLEWGIKEELYRPDIDVEIISKFRLESMMLAFNINIFPPAKFNLAHVVQEIIELYVFGIVTMKGYKMAQKYSLQMKNSFQKN